MTGIALIEGRPEYLRFSAPTYLLGWLYERLVNRVPGLARFRVLLVVALRKVTVHQRMPIRLLHYVACFYDHLLKSKATTTAQGLPPILPIVLYNGGSRWTVPEDVYPLVRPEPPAPLRPYQPRLRYYLIDEGRYTSGELAAISSPLSGLFEVENASADRAALQRAVERLVRLLQADPHKERLDRLITRWLKRHLQRLGGGIDLGRINSLVEDKAMLAENLENWARREREEGRSEGRREGRQEAARNLLKLGVLSDEQIAQSTDLSLDQVQALREADRH